MQYSLLLALLLFSLWLDPCQSESSHTYHHYHVVLHHSVGEPVKYAAQLASQHGFVNAGQLGRFENHFHFVVNEPASSLRGFEEHFKQSVHIIHFQKQIPLQRRTRTIPPSLISPSSWNDPYLKDQWYLGIVSDPLAANPPSASDIRVLPVWRRNITGKGVVISLLDDGVEYTHPDLQESYAPAGSLNLNTYPFDSNPYPRLDISPGEQKNHHGTRCAGEIFAKPNNSVCTVGIAYGAKFSAVRLIDGDIFDTTEAAAISYQNDFIDILSSSWGPADDGMTLDGPGPLTTIALQEAAMRGRDGYGVLLVFASGNGGHNEDNCNFDGYANSVYTITIGALGPGDSLVPYDEVCASTIAVTYSSSSIRSSAGIPTTDIHHSCTAQHTGTSASAPLAAGVLALVLEARPCLSWRDVQYLMVLSSVPLLQYPAEFQINQAGWHVSDKLGFGKIDADRFVSMAQRWNLLSSQSAWASPLHHISLPLHAGWGSIFHSWIVEKNSLPADLKYLEQVVVNLDIRLPRRGLLGITLESPYGTQSRLATPRFRDASPLGFSFWNFSSVMFWGESPLGKWTLHFQSDSREYLQLSGWNHGQVEYLQFFFFGNNMTPPSKDFYLGDNLTIQTCYQVPTKRLKTLYRKNSWEISSWLQSSNLLLWIVALCCFSFLAFLFLLFQTLLFHSHSPRIFKSQKEYSPVELCSEVV